MNILDNLTPFEKSVYEILNDKHVGYITGRYSTHATTKYEIMTSLKVMYKLPQKDDRLIRKAISSMRQKGINVGMAQPCGYGILNDPEMRIQRSELLSRVKRTGQGD